MNKSSLRKSLFAKRLKIKDRKKKELQIYKKLEVVLNNNSLIIGAYHACRSEVNLNIFLKSFLKKKFKLCLPFINKLRSPLIFREFSNRSNLINGEYNILVPDNKKILTPDILVLPIVGFDLLKNRIGYGGGYYDRTIQKLEKKKEILKVGVAFDEQEINKVPIEKFDKKLDLIITPKRMVV